MPTILNSILNRSKNFYFITSFIKIDYRRLKSWLILSTASLETTKAGLKSNSQKEEFPVTMLVAETFRYSSKLLKSLEFKLLGRESGLSVLFIRVQLISAGHLTICSFFKINERFKYGSNFHAGSTFNQKSEIYWLYLKTFFIFVFFEPKPTEWQTNPALSKSRCARNLFVSSRIFHS